MSSKSRNKVLKNRRARRILKATDITQISGRKIAHIGYGDGLNRRCLRTKIAGEQN